MSSKNDIINNLQDYSSEQIAEAITTGVVTLYELSKSGRLTPLMRKHIEAKLSEKPSKETYIPEQQTVQVKLSPLVTQEKNQAKTNTTTLQIEKPVNDVELVIPEAKIDEISIIEPILSSIPENKVQTTVRANSFSNKGMFKRPFSFKGRIRRVEDGLSMIISFVINLILQGILGEASRSSFDSATGFIVPYFLFYVPYFWFVLAQGAKRCHDLGNSGWYQIIPLYGFWMLFVNGEDGENNYGDNPKE